MKKPRIFVADFETTVYTGQTHTEVWAAALVELGSEDVIVTNSIDNFFYTVFGMYDSAIIYFHNLKFDGEFILNYLLKSDKFKHAFHKEKDISNGEFKNPYKLDDKEFVYSISGAGIWYSISLKNGKQYIEFRDSLKLIPTTVARMGESFKTKHRKLSIEYTGYRAANNPITPEEKAYIANDVLVVKEVLEIMYQQGHKERTIGSCCLKEYKLNEPTFGTHFDDYMPNLYLTSFSEEVLQSYDFGSATFGDYIHKSYHGGWCYVVDGKENIKYHNGTTADVNSLYPSMMHSDSGNKFPIGMPTFWIGNYIPNEAKQPDKYYFVRIKTQFRIKPKRLPCIQIKGDHHYRSTEWLKTSNIYSRVDHEYHDSYVDIHGSLQKASVILTLTMTDFQLIQEQYHLYNTEILDGCYFDAAIGIFDAYINKYRDIKVNAKGAVREIAKLFLNNLYGKMATSTDASFKFANVNPDGSLRFSSVAKTELKKGGYIPIGSAITSYARNFTIRAAQMNYNGIDHPGFIYADTDSIHCDLPPDQLKGIKVDNTAFCCWKLESCWDEALFVRQKTYAEHVTHENLKPVVIPYWELKCAGMPERCKDLFLASTNPYTLDIINSSWLDLVDDEYKTADAINFLQTKRTIDDFKFGLQIPGKLLPKHINGGIILEDTMFTMKENLYFL